VKKQIDVGSTVTARLHSGHVVVAKVHESESSSVWNLDAATRSVGSLFSGLEGYSLKRNR